MKVNINPNNGLAVRLDNMVLLHDLNISTYSDWVLGGTGNVGLWNAAYTETNSVNERVNDTTPWGDTDVVWKTYSSATGTTGNTLGGGIYSSAGYGWPTDNSKTYRFSCWVKRKIAGTAGLFYFGPRSFDSAGSLLNLQYRSTGAIDSNLYWYSSSFANLGTYYPVGEWILNVGFIYAYGTATGGTANIEGGAWKTNGVSNTIVYQELINKNNTSTRYGFKIFAPYNGSHTISWELYRPRIDLVDGTEPSLTELLRG